MLNLKYDKNVLDVFKKYLKGIHVYNARILCSILLMFSLNLEAKPYDNILDKCFCAYNYMYRHVYKINKSKSKNQEIKDQQINIFLYLIQLFYETNNK